MAEHSNLALYEALAKRQLDKHRRRIIAGYDDLAERAGSGTKWTSVYTTAMFVLSRYAGNTTRTKEKAAAAMIGAYLKERTTPTAR